jgi:hypothetical protein
MDTNKVDANSRRHDGRHAGCFIENGVGFPDLVLSDQTRQCCLKQAEIPSQMM